MSLDWYSCADRMLFFGVILGVSALIYLVLLTAEYKAEMRKRKKRRGR